MRIQCLDGEWSLKRPNTDESFHAVVPGSVHVDLMSAGVIPDCSWSDNEYKVAWVAESEWLYSRQFDVDKDLCGSDRIFLACDGLDTISTIRLNGTEIGKTDNMHRRYEFDVTSLLNDGSNGLEVEFASPVKHATSLASEDSLVVTPGDSINGSPYLRKAMYQWGWDWAPKIPTSGIWRSISLAGYST
ncbi:MAG TPA: glycoside hydrolase family 2 protein, partial [Armatimonadota bacterium]